MHRKVGSPSTIFSPLFLNVALLWSTCTSRLLGYQISDDVCTAMHSLCYENFFDRLLTLKG